MRKIILQVGITLLLMLVMVGCGGGNPASPGLDPDNLTDGNHNGDFVHNGRYTWGEYEITLDTGTMTWEIVPMRSLEVHYNVLQMLEGWGCLNCVTIEGMTWSDSSTLLVDVGIRHPAQWDRLDLTGFDVRGVAIFDAETLFPYHFVRDKYEVEQPLAASRILLNADGYTTHFNRETAFEGNKLYNYRRGRLTAPSEATIVGNLHGFISYWTHDYKRLFKPAFSVVNTYELDLKPQTFIKFAYSVDASWNIPLHWPVTEPVHNCFDISAPAREAFQISMTIDENDLTRQAGSADLIFDIFDHQGVDSISTITIEAPDLFIGIKSIDPSFYTEIEEEQFRYYFTVPNETGYAKVEDGGSDLLIVVEDWGMSIVGEDVKGYDIYTLPVLDVLMSWRHRENTFNNLPFPGPSPSGPTYDMTVIASPLDEYAIVPGEPMLVFTDESNNKYIACNRDFDQWIDFSGYPGNWLKPVTHIDAAATGAFGAVSESSTPVDGEYLVEHCTNMQLENGVYTFSWYTGTLSMPDPYLERAIDVSGGFGTSPGDPVYALYAFDDTGLYNMPGYVSLHRIADPYNDPVQVLRAYLPLANDLTNMGLPTISYNHAMAIAADDADPGLLNPYAANIYIAETRDNGADDYSREIDVFTVNFANPQNYGHLRTYHNGLLGYSAPWPALQSPFIKDIAILPAATNEIYMGTGNYAEHNWMVVLYGFASPIWFIEIYDIQAEDSDWMSPIYSIPAHSGNAFAMDVDPVNFEIYVLHDDLPAGLGDPRLTCFEYY